MPDANVDDWGRSSIGYLHGQPEGWSERCRSLEVAEYGKDVVALGGKCPVCGHPVSKQMTSIDVVALRKAAMEGKTGGQAQTVAQAEMTYIFTCNCVFAHPDQPDGVRGCGAQGAFSLVPDGHGLKVKAETATSEQFEADDWVESALRHRLARAREWATQWSSLLAAIIGFVSVAVIFDADAEELGLSGSAWQAYLGFAGAALALAVAAVILASVSAGLRGVKDVKVDVASRESRMQEIVASSGSLLFASKLAAGAGAACLVLALLLRFAG